MPAKMKFEAAKCPSDELSLTNKIFFNPQDVREIKSKYVRIQSERGFFVFMIDSHKLMGAQKVGFSMVQRRWAGISIGESIFVEFNAGFDPRSCYIASLVVEVDFLVKKNATNDPYNTDEMRSEFTQCFPQMSLTVGQELVFKFKDKKHLLARVKELEVLLSDGGSRSAEFGVVVGNSIVTFEKASAESALTLTGKAKGKQPYQSIINPDWNFSMMGIGGLDKEFSDIFRRTFASRIFPPDLVEQLGLCHVRGLLLYGPPGTGKTLMARQIGKMLNAREPKIVNGPSILDKYVGESEAKIRELFAEAEEEFKRVGNNSALHIVIFDEIDAICKTRGSVTGTQVHDTVVNQLLSKMEGVETLNNILVIGMTNRKDMIDEALLRPGRFEVQMEISLPDKHGRVQILEIHTSKIRENGKLAQDVDIQELAAQTKNFSGAELAGLVRAATMTAMNRLVQASDKVQVSPEAIDGLCVTQQDFAYALEHDVRPAFGLQEEELDRYITGDILHWGDPVRHVLEHGLLATKAARAEAESSVDTGRPVALLLEGPRNSGKTALAVHIARESGFSYVRLCTSKNMIGYSEVAKCQAVKKFFDDAHKAKQGVIILDGLEGLIDYSPVGPRYSNYVTQALRDLVTAPLPKSRCLLLLGTTSCREALEELGLAQCFTAGKIHVSNLTQAEQLLSALRQIASADFSKEELRQIEKATRDVRLNVGIKELLDVVRMTNQQEDKARVRYFLDRLQEDGRLY